MEGHAILGDIGVETLLLSMFSGPLEVRRPFYFIKCSFSDILCNAGPCSMVRNMMKTWETTTHSQSCLLNEVKGLLKQQKVN